MNGPVAFVRRGIAPDLASAADVLSARSCALGRPLTLLRTTTSTNDEAKHAAKVGAPHGATWVAEEQTAGRGRQGRAWTSPPGESLLVSTLARVTCPPAALPRIALVAGLAVRDAVAGALPGVVVSIKWPNDVLVGEDGGARKVAGVLVEAITTGSRVDAVVIGVGINVHTRALPPEIAGRATSIALASDGWRATHAGAPPGPSLDRGVILADLLEGLDRDLHVVLARGLGMVKARLDAADALRGRRVENDPSAGMARDPGAREAGIASGIDVEGRLVVARDDGVLARWSAGEVHLLPGSLPGSVR